MNGIEEKLTDLENRIQRLEKIEKRRQIFAIIKAIITILLLVGVIISIIAMYNRFSDMITPYKDIMGYSEDYDIKSIIEDYFK